MNRNMNRNINKINIHVIGDIVDENITNKRVKLISNIPNTKLYDTHQKYIDFIEKNKNKKLNTNRMNMMFISSIFISTLGFFSGIPPLYNMIFIGPLYMNLIENEKTKSYIYYRNLSDKDFQLEYDSYFDLESKL